MKRQKVYVKVLQAEQYDPEFPPSKLPKFCTWLDEQIAKIPEQYRDSATIDFDSVSDWGDSHKGRVEIQYIRPQTDEEVAKERERQTAEYAAREAKERQLLAALTAKYGK